MLLVPTLLAALLLAAVNILFEQALGIRCGMADRYLQRQAKAGTPPRPCGHRMSFMKVWECGDFEGQLQALAINHVASVFLAMKELIGCAR
jgi:hypothetical protein